MKKRIVSALLALVLILSNFTGGGLIEHVHVEAADSSALLQPIFEWTADVKDTVEPTWTNSADILKDRNEEFLNALNTEGAYLEIKGHGLCTEHGAMLNVAFNPHDNIFKSYGYPIGEFTTGGYVTEILEGSQSSGPVTSVLFQFGYYGHDAAHADVNHVYLNAITVYTPAVASELITLIENSQSVEGVSFEGPALNWDSYVINDSNPQWDKFIEAVKTPNARFVLKYTITGEPGKNQQGDDDCGWFNFFRATTEPGGVGHVSVPSYDGNEAGKFVDTLNDVVMDNNWSLLKPGEHVVTYKTADWIEYLEKHECAPEDSDYTHTAGDVTIGNIKGLSLQSGLAGTLAVNVSSLIIEAPEAAEPEPEPEPDPVPKPVAPEGYEIVYELDMTSANINPGHQGVNGDNAKIAEALQKDGAYVEFITCYPGANTGWIQIDFENGEYIQYNNYNTEIRTEMAGTDRTSIVRLPNGAVLDAIKQAEEKRTTIKGISFAAANYEPETEADTARENKCLGLFIYAKIPGDEPDLPTCEGHDDTWVVNDAPEKSEDEGTRFKIKLNEGDKIYNGDTLELHILGTADVEGKPNPGIRLYVASGNGYISNNLTGSYEHVAGIQIGTFEFDAKFVIDAATGNPSNPEAVKYIGDSIVFNINDGGYTSAEITHFAYKITHHEHSPLEGTYKPVEGGDTQHTYECSICHQTITENHTPGAEYGSDETSHWNKCDKCGGKIDSTVEEHVLTYKDNEDGKTHTVDCKTCGYKNESEEHVESKNKYDEDDVGRYHVCEYCGGRMDETKHDYEWVADEDGIHHHEECKTCHHKKTGSTEEHDYKNGKCSKCDYNHPEDEHVWGSWTPDFGGTTHTRTCSICGKEDTDPHNLPEKWTPSSEDETKHLKKCPDCGYEVTGEHNFGDSYEYVDAETHMQTCADCKKTVTSSHNYEEGKYSNSTTDHWQVCTDCKGESDRENHKYVDGSDRCSVCNYWNHQHTMKWMDDGKNHWEECTIVGCDYKTEKEPHVFDGSYDYNTTQHSQTCSVCLAKVSKDHILVDEYDDDFHWQECEVCDYETRATRHTLKTGSDENGHWEYCENCEYESDPVAHTPEKELGHDADSHWSICSECGEVYGKTAHTPSDELKHDSEGHWTVCSACGYENTDEKEAHIWDTGEITVEPTETTEGVKTYTCTECGETKTETVPKSAHKHVAGEEWKYDEKTHWHECVSETCDDKTAKLDEAAHTEDEGAVTKAATETEEGVKTYKCTVCGAVTRTETIPKVKHTHVAGKEWKHDEMTHWHECVSETCDDKTAKLDEAEHVWDDGKVTVEPTYTKEGEKLYTCEVCGETKTETVPVKGHEHSTVTKSDENGHWEECTICGETVGEVEAHTPGEWITDSEATSTEAGKRHKECTVCGYVTDVLEVPATGDIDVEVPTVGNVPKVELPAEQQEVLKNAIIDEEDVEAIESGASIDIELTVENAESTIAPEDKAKSDEAAAQGSYTHVRYLDINLTKVVTDASGASTSEEVSELGKEVKIVITVPLGLARQSGRDFAVIRVHDGEATVLKDLDSDPNTVTISTNLFSSYTLVYVDTTPVPSTPGGMIGHAHVITGLQNDAHYHWRGCFICSMRVDYEPHRFINGVCTVCGYRDPDYVPEVEEEEPAEEAPDTEVTVVDAPAEGTEQGGDSEGTPEVTDTPANLPETEAEVVEVKEDDETSENPKTGVVFTGIGAIMAAIAALVAKRK